MMKVILAPGRRSFRQDALALMGTQAAVMGIGILGGVVLARCLGAEGRGILAALLVYPSLCSSLLELGVRQSAIFHLGKQVFPDGQVVGTVITLMILLGLIGMVVILSLLVTARNHAFTPILIVMAAVGVPLGLVRSYASGLLLGKRLVGQFAKVERMVEIQRLLLLCALVWAAGWGVAGAMAANLASSLVVAAYALWRVASIAPVRPAWHWPVMRSLVAKGALYALALFVLALNYKVDIALMERLTAVSEIGYYAIATGVAQLALALPQSISTALFSHSATAGDPQQFSLKVARLLRVTMIAAFVIVAGLAVAAPWLIPLVYGAAFRPCVKPFWLLLPGVVFLLLLKVLAMDLAGRGRPNLSLWASLPALAVNIALNLWWLPQYGGRGAAVASSISYAVAGTSFMLIYCQVTGVRLRELWRYRRADFDFLRRLVPDGWVARFRPA